MNTKQLKIIAFSLLGLVVITLIIGFMFSPQEKHLDETTVTQTEGEGVTPKETDGSATSIPLSGSGESITQNITLNPGESIILTAPRGSSAQTNELDDREFSYLEYGWGEVIDNYTKEYHLKNNGSEQINFNIWFVNKN